MVLRDGANKERIGLCTHYPVPLNHTFRLHHAVDLCRRCQRIDMAGSCHRQQTAGGNFAKSKLENK